MSPLRLCVTQSHCICPSSTHPVNSTVCQFNGPLSSRLLVLRWRLWLLKPHLTSLILLFITERPVFLDRLPPLTSCKFLALIFFRFSDFPCSCPQLFGTPFLTQFVFLMHLTLFSRTLNHIFSKPLLIHCSSKLQRLRFIYVTNGAW